MSYCSFGVRLGKVQVRLIAGAAHNRAIRQLAEKARSTGHALTTTDAPDGLYYGISSNFAQLVPEAWPAHRMVTATFAEVVPNLRQSFQTAILLAGESYY